MKEIQWQLDEEMAYWAKRIPLPASLCKAEQFSGVENRMFKENWKRRLIGEVSTQRSFSEQTDFIVPSVDNIIECFHENYFLEGLMLTIGWGGMARAQKYIYDQSPDLEKIQTVLELCKATIDESGNVEVAWKLLTGKSSDQLGWGQVITSKVLHFLTRSCGYEKNPPVPFDNAVTWNQLRPWFFTNIAFQRQKQDPPIPQTWWNNNNSWEGYNRFMTAVICWSNQREWKTTDVDASVFAILMSGDNATSITPETDTSEET